MSSALRAALLRSAADAYIDLGVGRDSGYGCLMPEKPKIQMIASLAGDAFSYAPDQILTIGEDIEEGMAIALMSEPADDPRARPANDEAHALLAGEQPPPEPPPPREQGEDGEGEEDGGEEPAGGETATSPAEETRETATDKRRTRGRRQKPPKDADKLPEEEPPGEAKLPEEEPPGESTWET